MVPAGHRSGIGDPLDQAPALDLRERQAGRPVAQVERLPQLALREHVGMGQQVAVDERDGRLDAPRGAHVAPRARERQPDRLGVRPLGSGVVGPTVVAGPVGAPSDVVVRGIGREVAGEVAIGATLAGAADTGRRDGAATSRRVSGLMAPCAT